MIDLSKYGLRSTEIYRNLPPARLYERAIKSGSCFVVNSGGLATESGEKTGRCPKDKRIVRHPESENDVWWGPVNQELSETSFAIVRSRAIDYLNSRKHLYLFDGFAGWDPKYRLKIRVICENAYHALFMHNMLIRPSQEELDDFGEPDYVIFNAGNFPAAPSVPGVTSQTSVSLSFEQGQFVILGTGYAGEMKKGVFTVMNYLMPKNGILAMHCSANESYKGDVSLFFGLSGTGKTTLSAAPDRRLIGDDEHCWSADGVFNIEGGCYAKAVRLSEEKEPQIYRAIRFGSLLENVVVDPDSRQVDFEDTSITENTRVSYPIDYIPNAKLPCVGGHPNHIILLTCDAFGVLPPVSRLTPEQAMYHFISGYTAKVAGTEMGVTEPEATFSACFGAAFLVWHPTKYAEMLAEKMREHHSQAWLVNTGWTGGGYGVGSRMQLPHTRAIIDAIHQGDFDNIEFVTEEAFGLSIPKSCPGVPPHLLIPRDTWETTSAYDEQAAKLATLFRDNFSKYDDAAQPELVAAGP